MPFAMLFVSHTPIEAFYKETSLKRVTSDITF